MKIYIAAPFRMQEDVRKKALDLERRGHECTSTWRFETPKGDGSESEHREHYASAARTDLCDIDRADVLVLLAGLSPSGGKHFETGYAYHAGLRVYLVGPSENVFHWLIERYATWEEFLEAL